VNPECASSRCRSAALSRVGGSTGTAIGSRSDSIPATTRLLEYRHTSRPVYQAQAFVCLHIQVASVPVVNPGVRRHSLGALASRSCALYAILAFAANHNILIWRVKERKASSMLFGNRSRAKVACPRRVGCSSIMPGVQSDRIHRIALLLQSELCSPTMILDSWAYTQRRTKRKACCIKRPMKPPTDRKERPRERI
jgi:hypothetical protein